MDPHTAQPPHGHDVFASSCSSQTVGVSIGTVINVPSQQSLITTQATPTWVYSVKVINQARKSEFTIHKFRVNNQFESIEELKQQVGDTLKDLVETPLNTIGYIEPGHGAKGKQRWLSTDQDLIDMYDLFARKKCEILLWCYKATASSSPVVRCEKRPHSEESGSDQQRATKAPRTTRYDHHREKLEELEEIFEKLQDEGSNKEKYTSEQLRAWAHLLQMKKHESYEKPPDKPFFRNTRQGKKSHPRELAQQNSGMPSDSVVGLSPGKQVQLRGQLIDQISKLHDLLERGVISKTQYDQLQEKVMGDIEHY